MGRRCSEGVVVAEIATGRPARQRPGHIVLQSKDYRSIIFAARISSVDAEASANDLLWNYKYRGRQ